MHIHINECIYQGFILSIVTKTELLGKTQVHLPKTQLFFPQKLRFPKLSKLIYNIRFKKSQPNLRKTQVKILKTQLSETVWTFQVLKKEKSKKVSETRGFGILT